MAGVRWLLFDVGGVLCTADDSRWPHEFSSPWAAFLAAMQAMGAVADEVAFIDDRQDNISAAADLGMHTVLHRDNDSTVARLDELVGRTSQQPTSGSVES